MARNRQETLIGQCLTRSILALARADVEAGRDPEKLPTFGEKARTTMKASTMSTRMGLLIIKWSLALADLERDSIGIEEFVEWTPDSRSSVYRHLRDFRTAWPEYDTPNELAQVLARMAADRTPSLTTPLPVL